MTITKLNQLDLKATYSYADYLLWEFKERVELIKGKIFKMSPAPNSYHQDYSLNLTFLLGKYFRNSKCKLYVAPFDVRLINYKKSTTEKEIFSVVQPDLCVICDLNKIDEKGCFGSPDLIVEILSPGNSKKEMDLKFDLYEENGVKEYWIVEPIEKVVFIYVLQNNKFVGIKPASFDTILQSPTFEKVRFPTKKIFKL